MALTQARGYAPHSGDRYGSFAGRGDGSHPVGVLTQAGAFGAFSGRRYGSFAKGVVDFSIGGTIALTGSAGVSGAISIGTDFPVTGTVAMAGVLGVSGDIGIEVDWAFEPSLELALTGSMGVTGDISSETNALDLVATAAIGMVGAMGVSGDISIGTDFSVAGSVAMAGAMGITGSIEIGTDFPVTGTIPMAGTMGVTGDIDIDTVFDVSGSVGLTGVLGVSGDLAFSTEPIGGHGFEMGLYGRKGNRTRRGLVTIIEDEPTKTTRKTITKAAVDQRRFEKAREQAKKIIEDTTAEHVKAVGAISQNKRFAAVRTALKPIAGALGGWDWAAMYQMMYDNALAEQIKAELAIQDAIDEEEAVITLLLETM